MLGSFLLVESVCIRHLWLDVIQFRCFSDVGPFLSAALCNVRQKGRVGDVDSKMETIFGVFAINKTQLDDSNTRSITEKIGGFVNSRVSWSKMVRLTSPQTRAKNKERMITSFQAAATKLTSTRWLPLRSRTSSATSSGSALARTSPGLVAAPSTVQPRKARTIRLSGAS